MTQSRLKLALIGCGGIAQAHWQGIKQIATRIDVTTVVDTNSTNAKAMAEQTGAHAYTDLQEALQKGCFDAVDIMLPHDLHEFAALQCFAAAKHVLLEKPIAHTLQSAERILAASNRVDKVFMVAEQAQYWSDVIKARELMDAGAIGDIISASGNFYDRVANDVPEPLPWRYNLAKAGGGVTIDGGAHWIRPLRMMMGEVDEVIGVAGRHIPQMQGESWSRLLLKFENGSVATLACQNVLYAAGPVEMFRITGTEGEIQITGGRNGELILFNPDHPKGRVVMNAVEGKINSYGAELKDFSEVVLDAKTMAATPAYALGELRTALALYRSIESGRWEKVW
ncbi:MAG: Gfo/Idh/MocA family oxidoreductase [Pseudomonadota bacterium]